MEFNHKSVLFDETIDALNIKPDGVVVTVRAVAVATALRRLQGLAKTEGLLLSTVTPMQ